MLKIIDGFPRHRQVFAQWKAEGKTSALIAGAWSRPLFVGGWQHTGDHTETVYNLQVSCLILLGPYDRSEFT